MFRGSTEPLRDSELEAKDWGGKMGGSFRQRQGDTAQAALVQSRLSTVAKLYPFWGLSAEYPEEFWRG
eukprot:623754-Hanusia_phi.AAC.1